MQPITAHTHFFSLAFSLSTPSCSSLSASLLGLLPHLHRPSPPPPNPIANSLRGGGLRTRLRDGRRIGTSHGVAAWLHGRGSGPFSHYRPARMASTKACARVDGRVMPVLAASNAGDLPPDVMYEILLRLPAKVLCRLRTVCRFWQLLLSDPEFMAAHASCRRELPLIITGYNCYVSKTSLANIMDLSGDIIKQCHEHAPQPRLYHEHRRR
ncbi:hypothetical protein HU200_025057 [Digitaria exilis]|uniref:F-box domain-containing protein n=1 Tax=Digitaria exilis TaxID=1010633 RepID=A0A835BXI9_9POAL|nr:hypothetical protein HU200_025057 [Digitaria exilis]